MIFMYEEKLKKLHELTLDPLQKAELFTSEDLYDENGKVFFKGLTEEAINNGINYVFHTNRVFTNFYNCLCETVFIEEIISPENIPSYEKNSRLGMFLKINYQLWLIKLVSCQDCIFQILNIVYGIGLPRKAVNAISVGQNYHVINIKSLADNLKKLEKLFSKASNYEVPKNQIKSDLKKHRNKAVHYNELSRNDFTAYQEIAILMESNNWDFNVEFQGMIGKLSNSLIDEIKEINLQVFPLLISIFEIIYGVYEIKINKKLGLI